MKDWLVWQMIDSNLPTGGFAHSLGLESAMQERVVHDKASLHDFLYTTINQVGNFNLPMVYEGYMKAWSLDAWSDIDQKTNALLSNHVANRASRAQGNALLRIALSLLDRQASEHLKAFKLRIVQGEGKNVLYGHYAPLFGLVCRLAQFEDETSERKKAKMEMMMTTTPEKNKGEEEKQGDAVMMCQRMYLYCTLRDLISASTRLSLIGPIESAKFMKYYSEVAEDVLVKKANRLINEAYQSAPFLDIVQGLHDQLYSRIFNS